jgi:hypothetical protein
MFNIDWHDQVYQEASYIFNSVDFQKSLLKRVKAHGCSVRYFNHDVQGRAVPGIRIDYVSYLSSNFLQRHFKDIVGKLNHLRFVNNSMILGPSGAWNELGKRFPDDTMKIKAIIVGADNLLFGQLQNFPYLTVVKWPSNQISIDPPLEDSLNVYAVPRSYYLMSEHVESFVDQIVIDKEWIHAELDNDEMTRIILNTARFHIFSPGPSSFISIPIPLRRKPDEQLIDFFSVELFWCGTPVQATVEEILEAIAFSAAIAVGVKFPADVDGSLMWAKLLSQKAFERGSSVHTLNEWLESCPTFVSQNAYELFFVNGRLSEVRVCLAQNLYFYLGLKKISGFSEGRATSSIDLDALFVIAELHMFMKNCDQIDILTSRQYKITAANVQIDYDAWHRFLKAFDDGQTLYGDQIESILLEDDRLVLKVTNSHTILNLMKRLFILCHMPSIDRHQAAGNLYNALIHPNTSGTEYEEPENLLITGKSESLNFQWGNISNPHFLLELSEYNRSISLIIPSEG